MLYYYNKNHHDHITTSTTNFFNFCTTGQQFYWCLGWAFECKLLEIVGTVEKLFTALPLPEQTASKQ